MGTIPLLPDTTPSTLISETEMATIRGHRWWTVDELRSTHDVVYPEGLADLLERLCDP
jgi:hypothetical protein